MEDLSELLAAIQIQLNLKGLNWGAPRLKAWMLRTGCTDRHQLSKAALKALLRHLEALPALPPAVGIPTEYDSDCGVLARRYPVKYSIFKQGEQTTVAISLYGLPPAIVQQWIEESLTALEDRLQLQACHFEEQDEAA